MASVPGENSPPRQDALLKTRRLSSLIDSPSRVTRSQVRRLSSAAGPGVAEVPMSPKPAVSASTRRRSTVAAKSDAAHQDEAPAVQEEPDTGKTVPRRRSVRKSFADSNEEGPLSSRSSKLSSIDEDSKVVSKEESKPTGLAERPVTRRTRASMASALEPEPELSLPPTRRTRRSSVSSVSSITSSIVASPKTRSRKNLSPVPSPTFSEVSTMSEVPEISPASKTSLRKDSSPMTKKSEKKLGTPRQLQLHDLDSSKTKRSSFVVSENIQGEEVSPKNGDVESFQPMRRSQGRLSSKSPLKFVETAMQDTVKSNDVEKKSNDDEGNVEAELNKSRSSIGRLSLSSNKSSPNKLSPSVLEKFESSPHLSLSGSRRNSGKLALSSSKASPAESSKSDLHLNESQEKVNSVSKSPFVLMHNLKILSEENAGSPRLTANGSLRESTGRPSRRSSPFKFEVTDKVSPKKSQPETSCSENVSCQETAQEISSNSPVLQEENELNSSRRSVGKSENFSTQDSSVTKVSTEQQVFDLEDSSTDPSLVEVVVEKRNSLGRMSLSSNKVTPGKPHSPDGSSEMSNIETKGRFSISSSKSTPAKSPNFNNFEVSSSESQKTLVRRFSLSSNKSTPAKSPQFDVSNSDSNQKTSLNRSSSSNKATPSKSSKADEDISTPSSTGSSNKSSPANSSECDSPQLTNEDAPNTFLSRFSLSFNKSTPAKASPEKSPKCENTPQLNESHRSSIGRLSSSSNKSPHSVGLKANNELEHFSDNEESDSVSSSDPSQHDESMGKLNLSGKAKTPSSTKSTGRPSLTPNKSLNISHHQEEDSSNDNDDASNEANDDSSNEASDEASNDCRKLPSEVFSNLNRSEVSRRASTGNLSRKPLKSDFKTRASMGPLINPSMSYLDDSEGENDSFNLSGEIGDSSNSANDRHQFGEGELTLSPIKQDIPSKKRSLTPSDKSCSEPERQNSPNNLFEKSTVFNNDSFASNVETSNQALEMSVSSHKPSNLNISINDEKNVSIAVDQLAEAADLDSLNRSSKTPAKDVPKEESIIRNVSSHKKLGLSKVYQAAAVLMSGGQVSDFDDDDSDDSQLQTVFSPSTMSKKDLRREKKAQKKAEKEARKKRKQERSLNVSVADLKPSVFSLSVTEDREKPENKENTFQFKNSPQPGNSKKRKSLEANLPCSEASNVVDEQLDLSEKTVSKRRKTLSQSDIDLPLEDNESFIPSPLKNDEKPTETNKRSAKKAKKPKSGSADLEIGATNDHEESETLNTLGIDDVETACKNKKQKAKTITATEIQQNAVVSAAASKNKKKKLKKKDLMNSAPTEELSLKADKKKLKNRVLDDEVLVENLSVKTKKKKKKLTSENHSVEEITTEALKMKKKKKHKDLVLEPLSVSEENFSNGMAHDFQKQKKSKKMKLSKIDKNEMDENSTTRVKLVDDTNATDSGLGKKLKKKKKGKLMPDESKDVSGKQPKKKLKEKGVLELPAGPADFSDSEDEPTSVSFAEGKSAALALMEAAAVSIKKQKEMKKMKMKKMQEKIKEEKSAKMRKQKKKYHDVDVESRVSMKGGLPVTTSSKIFFDDKDNSQKVKPAKRLPTDFLESLSEQPPTKFLKRPDGSKEKVPADAVSHKEHKQHEMKRAKILARKLEREKLLQSEYVPLEGVLGATRFGVVPLRNVMLAKKLQKSKLAEEASKFRQESLFGSRVRRTPISSTISYEEKQKARGPSRFMAKK